MPPAHAHGRVRSLRTLPFLLVLIMAVGCASADGGASTTGQDTVTSTATQAEPTTTTIPPTTSTTIDAAGVFANSLEASRSNYRFISTVTVGETDVTTISGVVDSGSVSATIASGTGEVSYVRTAEGEWITDGNGVWIDLEGESPVNPPLDYLADTEDLGVVANDETGIVLGGVLGPSAGTVAGVPFRVMIVDGLMATISYEATTGGEVAVVTTTLSDVGAAGTVTPPEV